MTINHLSISMFLLMFLLIIFSSSNLVFPVKADAQVELLTSSSYIDSLGWLHVVGEAQNVGNQAVEYVRISATFYDSSNTVVGTAFTYSDLNVILPNRKSPFDILLYEESQSSKVDHYELSVSFSTTVSKQQSLQILSYSSYIDSLGWFHIVGEVENTATGGATYVKVIATCYESGTVINNGFDYTTDLDRGQKAPFEILIIDNNPELISSYELTVESSEFAEIPEFSSIILFLLIFPLLGLIIYSNNRKNWISS